MRDPYTRLAALLVGFWGFSLTAVAVAIQLPVYAAVLAAMTLLLLWGAEGL